MSMDALQERVRRLKNPVLIDLSLKYSELPPQFLHGNTDRVEAYCSFCMSILDAMKGTVAGVRLGFATFALLGADGLRALSKVLHRAGELGYYVALEAPVLLSAAAAASTAEAIWDSESPYPCDGLILGIYPGSDIIRPFLPYLPNRKKDLFCIVRTSNRSAPEIQDLLTGSRLVHAAAADLVNRFAPESRGRYGYSGIGLFAGGNSAESLRTLRTKYPELFILIDDVDYPGCNAKICAQAFDRFGHGAAVCAGTSVTAAWKEAGTDGADYLEQAGAAAERLKRNLTRYLTIL